MKSLITRFTSNGYEASNVKVSELNDRSVVIGTRSSPTLVSPAYIANQLSAHTSALNLAPVVVTGDVVVALVAHDITSVRHDSHTPPSIRVMKQPREIRENSWSLRD